MDASQPVFGKHFSQVSAIFHHDGRKSGRLTQGIIPFGIHRKCSPEEFSRETFAFWKWIWDTRKTHRIKLINLIAAHPHLTVRHLTSTKAVRDFYQQIGENPADH